MKLTKKEKQELSRQLAQIIKKSGNLYFTQYQGLKFQELAELRKKLKPFSCKYQVMKNSLVANALKEAGITGAASELLKGPIGLVVAPETDPVAAAKILAAFAKEFPLLKVKAGYVASQWLSSQECMKLSALGSKAELTAKLAGTLYAAVAQSAGVLAAPIRDFVLVLKALERKKGEAPAAA